MLPSDPLKKTCLALAIAHTLTISPAQAATIIVNTTSDTDGPAPCTLREAIVSIHTPGVGSTGCTYSGFFGVNDTISFNSGLYDNSIVLDQATPLAITKDLIIDGLGKDHLTIDGGGNGTAGIFSINNATVNFNGVKIFGGSNSRGGGLYVSNSVVNLSNTTVSGNYSSGNGGGIYANVSNITLKNSTVSGNRAKSRGGGIIAGPGASISLTNSNVSSNSAGSNGGGIYDSSGHTVSLIDSSLSGNSAVKYGGGIFVIGQMIGLERSTLTGNSAKTGGGVFAYNATVEINHGNIRDNIATALGGGIYAADESEITLTNSTVSSNLADTHGGGIFADSASKISLFESTVSGNSAMEFGGGISSVESRVHLNNSTVSGNSAKKSGGGILFGGNDSGDFMTVWHSTITNNTADDDGGGIGAIGSVVVRFTNSIISGNMATDQGDEIGTFGGTFIVDRNNLFGDNSKSNAQAFSDFSPDPSDSDITATSDGTMPTALAAILQTTLKNNAGPTKTHALVVSSPAINAGNPHLCRANDQRGETRSDGKCDIGSYEFIDSSCYVINTPADKTVVFCL